jgi:UDP-N-acetylmuramate dehydrogenase
MRQAEQVSLRRYNTFGVEAKARHVVQLESESDLEGLALDPETDLVLGGGSNILFAGDVDGTVIINRIGGFRIVDLVDDVAVVDAAGGAIWHSLVLWSLAQGLSGLENLSLIPGLVGAAPMQNIGAYGVEISDHLESVRAWDRQDRAWISFSNRDCRFGYRDSRFKKDEAGRYLITSVRLRLNRKYVPELSYAGLREELSAMEIDKPTAQMVSKAVILIRKRKLPDPARLGNAGSFFKNPMLHPDQAESLRSRFDGFPVHLVNANSTKLSAAWMIDHCGWKGHREGDAGVYEKHALVLVNHGNATGRDILSLANRISASVADEFGVNLEPEPRIIL